MQKLELRNNLSEILKRLKSTQIIELLKPSSGNVVDKTRLVKLLIDSKAGYDQQFSDKERERILQQFDAANVYSTGNFSILISFSSAIGTNPVGSTNIPKGNLLANDVVTDFYSFHKTLQSTFNLIDNLLLNQKELFDENNDFNIDEAQGKGNLILEIVDNGNIGLKKLNYILQALEKLIEIIYLLYDKVEKEQFVMQPSVILVDSGSDISFIFKLPEKAANLIAQVIREAWDFVVNNKNYKLERNLRTLEKSLTVIGKLKEANDRGDIDRETTQVLKQGLIENVEKLISNNTVTKQIIMEENEFSNRQILIESGNRYLLENGANNPSEKNTNSGETPTETKLLH